MRSTWNCATMPCRSIPSSTSHHDLPGDIARRDIGGLGLHLARSIASDFHYARDAHGNRVVIRFDPSDEPAT